MTTKAPDFLNAALSHMEDRATTYDRPSGERSMCATVEAFKAIAGHDLTEEQGWLFMAVLKFVRSQQGQYKADSYEDGAAYFALAGEAAAMARGSMPDDFGQKNMMDFDEARADAIGQNGNDGAWYQAQEEGYIYSHFPAVKSTQEDDGA